MSTLPSVPSEIRRDVFDMLILNGLASVTKSLRYGDKHNLDTLRPLANRCRALADAFDARMEAVTNEPA